MKRILSIFIVWAFFNKSLFAAEAGMPQLDPAYWASQALRGNNYFCIKYIF
jgi:hypothetical protein